MSINHSANLNRRSWIAQLMLAGLASQMASSAEKRLGAGKAKHIIFLNMTGGTSQIDLWDHKPKLFEFDGQPLPDSLFGKGERFANVGAESKVMPSPFGFKQHGETRTWISDLLPHTAQVVDDLCLVHSMCCDEINHPAAQLLWQTGFPRSGRPSMGSWINHAIGNDESDLPGFVLLQSGEGPECGDDCTNSGFLPNRFRAVRLQGGSNPMDYLLNPPGIDPPIRSRAVAATRMLNEISRDRTGDNRVNDYSQAIKKSVGLQRSIPELVNVSDETQLTLERYGVKDRPSFGLHCLLARRLVQRGVPFVQLNHGDWDFHSDLPKRLPKICMEIDQGAAALVKDLKDFGLLDETLVVWGSEFGRTPMRQRGAGRDHHRFFTIWMAGGGIKPGLRYGATDEFGYGCIEKPVPVHDFQATVLHLLGIDHRLLTYQHNGRDFRLTDVGGKVIHDWLN